MEKVRNTLRVCNERSCAVIAAVPWNYYYANKFQKRFQIFWSILWMCIISGIYYFTYEMRNTLNQKYKSVVLLDSIVYFTMTFGTIIHIITTTVVFAPQFRLYFNFGDGVDRFLLQHKYPLEDKFFEVIRSFIIIGNNLVVLGVTAVFIWHCRVKPIEYFYSNILQYFELYYLGIAINTSYLMASKISRKFLRFNEDLYKTVLNYDHGMMWGDNLSKNTCSLKKYLKCYVMIDNCVQAVNKLFGLRYLMFIIIIVMQIIHCINYVLRLSSSEVGYDTIEEIAIMTIYPIYLLVQAVELTLPASLLAKNAKETGVVCRNLLNKLAKYEDNVTIVSMREDLELLVDYVGHANSHVSAAGFFAIDNTLVLNIFGQVASNLMIVLAIKD